MERQPFALEDIDDLLGSLVKMPRQHAVGWDF
jgi:hypothetical protein